MIRHLFCVILFSTTLSAQGLYFPPLTGGTWETVTPASLGWDESRLPALDDFLNANNTKAFIVLKDGRIVVERYFGTFTADSNWYWASAGKTMTAALVGIAQQEGLLSIGDASSKYMGRGWTSLLPDTEDRITVRHQLTMTSGLDDGAGDGDCTLPSCLVYKADAGTRWAYHNAPYTLLDSVLESATSLTLNQLYLTRMRSRIGMNGAYLRSGPYNNVLFTTPRSMARFGLLMLGGGYWASTPVISDVAYIHQMTTPSQQLNKSYGFLWWLNGQESHMLPKTQVVFPGWLCPDAPADMFAALGKNGQILCVVPGRNLVVVRMGNDPDEQSLISTRLANEIWKRLNDVMRITSDVKQLDDTRGDVGIGVFPNPVRDVLILSSWNGADARVIDVLGRELWRERFEGTIRVPMSDRLPGVYFVRTATGMRRIVKY